MTTPTREATATEEQWASLVAKARSPETRAKLAAGAATFTDASGVRYRAPAAVLTRSGGHAPEFVFGQPIATDQPGRLETLGVAPRQLGVDVAATRATEVISADDDLEATIARELAAGDDDLHRQIALDLGSADVRPATSQRSLDRTGGDELEASIQSVLRGQP